MNDASKIALAIFASGVLVAGVLVWQGRLEPQAQSSTTVPVPVPIALSVSAGASARAPLAGVLTNQEFMPLWEAGPADKAKTDCFDPAERRGPSQSVLHFTVKIRPSGEVSDVTWDSRDRGVDELQKCVAGVIRGMRFAARADAAEGLVQAARPGAFTISDGAPPARR